METEKWRLTQVLKQQKPSGKRLDVIIYDKINLKKFKKIKYDSLFLHYTLFMFGDNSLASLYLNERDYSSEKRKILKAMREAHTSLFDIIKTDASGGYVYLENVFTGAEFKVFDKAMSLNENAIGKAIIYSRLVTVDGITFNNVALPIIATNKKLLEFIDKCQNNMLDEVAFSMCVFEIFNRKDNKVGFSLV